MRRLSCIALSLLCGACAGATAAPRVAAPAAQEPGPVLFDDELSALAESLVREGYRKAGEPETGFLAPSTRVSSRISLPARRCVAIAAMATPGIADLDAAVYAADGTALAEDSAAGARPILRLCTGAAPLSAYLVLFAFQGTGSYAVQRFERAAGPDDELFSGNAPTGSAAFQELLRVLRGRGYRDETPPIEVRLVRGVASRLSVKVRAGHCYSVVADGGDLRVRLLDEEGREVALGVGVEGPAALQHCAGRDADLTLELEGTRSGPSAVVARLLAPQAEVGGSRSVWLGEPAPALSEAVVASQASAKNVVCGGAARSLARHRPLAQGSVWERELEASTKCASIEAELHDGLMRATLRVEAPDGGVLAESEVLGKPSALYVCGASAPARVSLIARAGFGAVSVTSRSCP